jgi:membrane protease subunit HflK
MPWNDNGNPGPWGAPPPSGGKGPSDEGPRRPGGPGPRRPTGQPDLDLDAFQQRLKDSLRDLLGGSGGSGGGGGDVNTRRMAPLFAGGLAALYLLSGIIVVGAKEEAVVTTFGAWTRSYVPGIGYHLPLIESVRKVDITTLRKTEIGGETGSGDTLMLTGDENIVDLSFSVTWRVSNPGWYLFNIDKQEETVRAVAESAMREVIGRSALDPIISRGRGQIQIEVAELMQRILDGYNAGIIIDGVQYDAGPPKEVVDAFRDVNNASQNAESRANQARGTAAEVVQQAKGYQSQVVREALGDAARFNQVYDQYRLAPGVTRDRLYIETMERVLSRTNKVIIDSKGASAPIILPPDVFRPRALPSPTVAPAPAQGAVQ